jgi:hypothetical protein
LKVSEIESISLVTRTPRALEIEPRGLTNSVGLGHVLLKWAEYRVTGALVNRLACLLYAD